MKSFVKYFLISNKNISKVKYYILFASALFILLFFFDSKSSKSESQLNKLVHDLHMTNDLHATKTPIVVTQQKFKVTKGKHYLDFVNNLIEKYLGSKFSFMISFFCSEISEKEKTCFTYSTRTAIIY